MSTRATQHFCARESLAMGDPLAGSAAHAERNVLLSWPRSKWRRSLRRASDMPDDVAAQLEAIAEAGRRVNLIHRRDQPGEHHRLYLMPENRRYEMPRAELPAVLDALQRGEPLTRWEMGPPQGSLLLCCTHGKKDKCCAKFGYAAYKALEAAVAERALPFEVWESTHLGGCRLAASAVAFPALRKYGRIATEDVLPLLEAEMADRPYLPCYRGDSRLSPVQQCAQVAALEWLASCGIHADVTVAPSSKGHELRQDWLQVRWRSAGDEGRLAVRCEPRMLRRYDTCADLAVGPPAASQVWVATQVEVAEGRAARVTSCS
ncbi:sucrase ferredoxin [Halomonas sp. MCCC 1A17488]|uniref:sucrase ferredoxin n=1 Tax=unclassified Halomonas TaxID=2609666 RepID=UPI0018D25447|nr:MULTISPECIES: sucrase ferredoxin [unclassified Halomonas]MCE8015642.1 sucrase ferredoxin [Halomonas sp. MCCC 1A17488]MCG3238975.1 sucrase ferredoxin [Halomonas sp. MCCC 1A17488]QPP51073.1 sucrase ferredoxin [Halomonas sp. SS10-MC5]